MLAFSRPRAGGIIALDLVEGDELIAARITDGTQNVFLSSAMGKSIRFHESDIRPSSRIARGVRGMRLDSGDRLVGMGALRYGATMFAVTENGFGKRTSIDEYPVHKRGGKGVITIKTNERNGTVVGVLEVQDDDDLMLVTDRGQDNPYAGQVYFRYQPQYAGRQTDRYGVRRTGGQRGCTG